MALIRDGRVAEGQLRVDRILGRGESAEAHFLLGAALFTKGDFPAATKEFSKAAALNPDVPSLHSYYGQALLFSGDADGAVAEFRKELAANPNDFDANLQLASILSRRGKPDEARPLLERAVQVRPGSAEARDALANGFRVRVSADGPGIAAGSPAPPIATLDLGHPVKARRPGLRQLYLPETAELRRRSETHLRAVRRPGGFSTGVHPRGARRGRAGSPVAEHDQRTGRDLAGGRRATCRRSGNTPSCASGN